ncbi:WSC domain-containing protein [Flammula alnicola]|nr:WSC domain-containing protein [Flammula alnicola]
MLMNCKCISEFHAWNISQVILKAASVLHPVRQVAKSNGPIHGWNHVGCFSDNTISRTLNATFLSSTAMTPALCTQFCFNQGFGFAGLESGNFCWCGDAIQNSANQMAASDCDLLPCIGDSTLFCGGNDRIDIFTDGSPSDGPIAGWTSVGCFTDNVSARTLGANFLTASAMTQAFCTQFCFNQGQRFAGLESGQDCWCDLAIQPTANQTADSDCDLPCNGDPTFHCGGNDRIQIFTDKPSSNGPIPGWNSVGCFTDRGAARTLRANSLTSTEMTPLVCTQFCFNHGKGFAGLEFGEECWCDGVIQLSANQTADSDCDLPCAGDSTLICGGNDRIQILTDGAPSPAILQDVTDPLHQTLELWQYVGCYADNPSPNRILQRMVGSGSADTCPNICQEEAFNSSGSLVFTFAGIDNGDECWCGTVHL